MPKKTKQSTKPTSLAPKHGPAHKEDRQKAFEAPLAPAVTVPVAKPFDAPASTMPPIEEKLPTPIIRVPATLPRQLGLDPKPIAEPLQFKLTLGLATKLSNVREYVENKLVATDNLVATGIVKLDTILAKLNAFISYDVFPLVESAEEHLLAAIKKRTAHNKALSKECPVRADDHIRATLKKLYEPQSSAN